MYDKNKSLLLFKWPSDKKYQERLLRVISLPVGAKGEIYYNKKWISDEILGGDNLKIKTIFMIAAIKHTEHYNQSSYEFLYAHPFRLFEVRKIRVEHEEDFYFEFITGDYLGNIDEKYDKEKIEQMFNIKSFPGQEKGYAHLVESQTNLYHTNSSVSLEKIFNILSKIPCSRDSEIAMKDYPLIRISSVNDRDKIIDPDPQGTFNLFLNQVYKIKGEFYQGNNNKEREFSINDNRYLGRRESFEIKVENKLFADIGERTIDLKVDFGHPTSCKFTIILLGLFKQRWWRKPILSLVLSLIAMAIFWIFKSEFPSELFTALILFYFTYFFVDKK